MKQTIVTGLIMLVVIWLLAELYELLPGQEAWVVFGAMAGMAMSLRRGAPSTGVIFPRRSGHPVRSLSDCGTGRCLMGATRRKFSREFKVEAVRQLEAGRRFGNHPLRCSVRGN